VSTGEGTTYRSLSTLLADDRLLLRTDRSACAYLGLELAAAGLGSAPRRAAAGRPARTPWTGPYGYFVSTTWVARLVDACSVHR